MPDCSYCGESFDDDHAHLVHLRDEHEGELGTIDRRRVDEELDDTGDDDFPTGPVVLGIVLSVAVAIVIYVIFFVGSGSGESGAINGIEVAQMPGQVDPNEHDHGLINVSVNGEELDFSREQYQLEADQFHFEGGDGEVWHRHADGVTLEYAMATLGIDVERNSVTIDGTTYRDSNPGTNVTVTVDGTPVNPETYELEGVSASNPGDGDYIRIIVTTDESSETTTN